MKRCASCNKNALVLRKLGERLYCKACLSPLTAPSPGISRLVERATALATELHEGQFRKGTELPYITHPVAVAVLVTCYGGSDQQIAAALLHDTVEDCAEGSLERIRTECGESVAKLVLEVTKPPGSNKPEQVAHLSLASKEAALVSACDKLHNMLSIINDGGPWERFKGGRERVTTYYTMVCPLLAWKLGKPSIESALRECLDKLLSLP